jgi:hypothetical protein
MSKSSEVSNLIENLANDEKLIVAKGRLKTKPKQNFVMVFNENLSKAMKNGLSGTDIAVLFSVIKYVSWGNVINLTQQTIADDLDMLQSAVSRSFKKLEQANIFYRTKGSLFLNPNFLVKGDLTKSKDSEAYKVFRANLYKEFGEIITDPKQLEDKVNSLMSF